MEGILIEQVTPRSEAAAAGLAPLDIILTCDGEPVDVNNLADSIAGSLDPTEPLVVRRPSRSPHHTVSDAGLLGGQSKYPDCQRRNHKQGQAPKVLTYTKVPPDESVPDRLP